ncbi:hypothetical protein, partial [uncultured Alistipes sp.]|uniref:hypothetical protein n=1 Tax=uncultured Alistipes sp. TaxID=538949 RepID=UPI00272DBD9C
STSLVMKGSRVQISVSARKCESAAGAGTNEKPLQGYLKAFFFISGHISRSDFRSFDSAPAASRRDKTSITKLNLGFGSENQAIAFLTQSLFLCSDG